MSLPLHSDGCIAGNIPVKRFQVTFAPKCEHTKMKRAVIELDARTLSDAQEYAETWIHLAQMSVIAVMPVDNEYTGPPTPLIKGK